MGETQRMGKSRVKYPAVAPVIAVFNRAITGKIRGKRPLWALLLLLLTRR